ncbi:MAG: hypothetical protein AAFP98_11615 [Pseudomonadota bacterium]
MLKSTARPDLGWGRPILAALAAIVVPAVPAFFVVWGSDTGFREIMGSSDLSTRAVWLVAACLMAAPLVAWIAVPISAPLARIAARRGWAGPGSMVVLSWAIGLPLAHIVFNGDLTSEAPEVIPFLALALAIQALCGWLVLRQWRPAPVVDSTQSAAN